MIHTNNFKDNLEEGNELDNYVYKEEDFAPKELPPEPEIVVPEDRELVVINGVPLAMRKTDIRTNWENYCFTTYVGLKRE